MHQVSRNQEHLEFAYGRMDLSPVFYSCACYGASGFVGVRLAWFACPRHGFCFVVYSCILYYQTFF